MKQLPLSRLEACLTVTMQWRCTDESAQVQRERMDCLVLLVPELANFVDLGTDVVGKHGAASQTPVPPLGGIRQ